jgi:hypothetical protein
MSLVNDQLRLSGDITGPRRLVDPDPMCRRDADHPLRRRWRLGEVEGEEALTLAFRYSWRTREVRSRLQIAGVPGQWIERLDADVVHAVVEPGRPSVGLLDANSLIYDNSTGSQWRHHRRP